MLFGCDELIIATLLSILFLPTWVMHWCFSLSLSWKNTKFTSIIFTDPQTLAVALARLLACEGQTMDSMFDPSQCSPQERMSSFTTMTKMTYMITQQL